MGNIKIKLHRELLKNIDPYNKIVERTSKIDTHVVTIELQSSNGRESIKIYSEPISFPVYRFRQIYMGSLQQVLSLYLNHIRA